MDDLDLEMNIIDLLTNEVTTYENNTDSKGLCIFNLSNRENPFKFTLSSQSNLYNSFVLESSMLVTSNSKRNTLLLCNNTQIQRYNQVAFKLFGENGACLSNKKIKITVSGVTYNTVSNEDGVVWLTIRLRVGDYEILCEFDGDYEFNPCKCKLTLTSQSENNEKPYLFVDCGIVHDLTSSELTSANEYITNDYLAHSDLNTQTYLINKFIVDGVLEWI